MKYPTPEEHRRLMDSFADAAADELYRRMKERTDMDETTEALESCLKYLEMVKRNEEAILKAMGHNGAFLVASLDVRIAKVKAALSRRECNGKR